MANFFTKCKNSVSKALDYSFFSNIANVIILIVAAFLLISLMVSLAILIALALFGLFVWAIIYC
jgi:hypothetical protein